MDNDDIITIEDLKLCRQTDLAYLVCDEDNHKVWIPRSQVKSISFGKLIEDEDGNKFQKIVALTIPQWLADEKELF